MDFDVKEKEKKAKRICKDEALFWLEYGDRTEKEMVRHLNKKGYDEREIAECMAFLIDYSFIDDRRYALKFVESSMEKGRGPMRIRHELSEKGIAGETVDEAIRTLYDRSTEREIALQVAEKALRSIDSPAELSEKDKAKIARKLAAMGFSAGAAYDAINRLK